MNKLISAVALLGASSLLLAGCTASGGDPSTASGGDPSTEEVTLKLAWQAGDNAALDAAIAAFEEANPGVTVELETAADADLQSAVSIQLNAGTGPDVFMVWPGKEGLLTVGGLAESGFLASLDDLEFASAAGESALAEGVVDGTLRMALLGYGPLSTIYNLDALDSVGLSVPETWDELLAFCSDATAAGKTAYGLGLQNGWTTQLIPYALLAPIVSDIPAWNAALKDGTFNFAESEEWQKALEYQQEMDTAGCFNDSPNGTDIDSVVLPGVGAGEFLGVTTVAGHIGVIQAGGGSNLSTRPLPAVSSPDENRYFMLPANGLAVNATSEHPELAMKLIEALTTIEFLNAYATQSGFLPTVPNDEFEISAPLEYAWAFIEEGRTASGQWIPTGDVQNSIFNGVQELFLGSVTVEQMLQNVQDTYEASQ